MYYDLMNEVEKDAARRHHRLSCSRAINENFLELYGATTFHDTLEDRMPS